jgi:hypothetical protein
VKKCFYCGNDILKDEGRIVPLDRPYANLWAHKIPCASSIDEEYLRENIERIYEFANNYVSQTKEKVKRK